MRITSKINVMAGAVCAGLLFGVAVLGCTEDGDSFVTLGSTTLETRADFIATSVEDSWPEGEQSINIAETDDFEEFRLFSGPNNESILLTIQGDDGNETLNIAFQDDRGAARMVPIRGTMNVNFDDEAAEEAVVLWTPGGDAVIALMNDESADPSVTGDVDSRRVYVGSFTRSLARTPVGPNGERYGFSDRFVAVDTNSVNTDDNGVSTLFLASNLVDGSQTYDDNGTDDEDLELSGAKGDGATDLTPVAFIGWVYEDDNADDRVEGYFVDLGDRDLDNVTAELIGNTPTQITLTGISAGESVDVTVHTSGRDMLFTAVDTGTPDQHTMWLVRLGAGTAGSAPSVGSPIEISRGTNTNLASSIDEVTALIGDGYRALNGQDTTWVVYRESGFEDGTVTQADTDLVVAQVSATGTVEVDEFDHNTEDSANANDANSFEVQLKRGATRAFLYYRQTFDVTGGNQTDDSLFVRALRLDGLKALTDNVSAEETINDEHDSDDTGDTDVLDFDFYDDSPFCSADVNNDTSYVVFRQQLDGDVDLSFSLLARLVTINDITASPIAITLSSLETIEANVDPNTGRFGYMVWPGSRATGQGVVTYNANGNNISDAGDPDFFGEDRLFLYAPALPDGQSIASGIQIDSDSATGPGVSPADYQRLPLEDSQIGGIATPNTPAERDFTSDDDEASPDWLHIVFPEFWGDDTDEAEATFRGRSLDLRSSAAFANALERFSPLLTRYPDVVGTNDGQSFDDLRNEGMLELVASGNAVLAVFNMSQRGDDSSNDGRIYVNTWNNGAWSDASLFSNDGVSELGDDSNGLLDNGGNIIVYPGFDGTGCDTAIGTRVYYLRELDASSSDQQFFLQMRRITGTNLPPQ